jgi:hypothetical protein
VVPKNSQMKENWVFCFEQNNQSFFQNEKTKLYEQRYGDLLS